MSEKGGFVPLIIEDFKRRIFLILCLAFISASLFFVFQLRRAKDTFEVSAMFVVSSSGTSDSLKNLSKAQEVSGVLSRILDRPEIRKIILQEIGESELGGTISCELVAETNLVRISTASDNLRRAYLIINSILDNQKTILEYISDDVNMTLLVSPSIKERSFGAVKAAAQAGIVFAGAFALLSAVVCIASYLSKTVKTKDDLENRFGIKCLGIIPKETGHRRIFRKKNLLISRPSVSFQYVESINRLCRKIRNRMHGDEENLQTTLLVTSSRADEGKSTIASNIAYSLYDSGKNVLIIDLDLMNPSIYKIFTVTEKLSEFKSFLEGEEVKNLIRKIEPDGLSAILNTEKLGETVDLISSKRLQALLEKVKEPFDYVIIDCPPINSLVDAELIADIVDCTLLVVRQDFSSFDEIGNASGMLQNSKSVFLGGILNNAVIRSEVGGYDYYHKYKNRYYSYYSDGYYKREA